MERIPSEIKLLKKSRQVSITFNENEQFDMSFEYLRVHSPSAEVKGHGPGQEVLQTGKETVLVNAIEPVGRYAIRLIFDDGHDTGLYTWQYLYELGSEQEGKWQAYLDRLSSAGYARQPTTDS